ncbi:MAG: extracellular solute-binding protein [Clostridia bacterium]|nr:extracellular solute-binding protein [Clostridia bacterium]
MMKKRFISVVAVMCGIVLFAGCNGKNASRNGSGDNVLTIWMRNSAPIGGYTDKSQFPFKEALEQETGIKLDFIFPALGQDPQQFNLLLASRNLPDIVSYYWGDIPGGAEKAIKDGYILKMDDAFLKKNSPDFYEIINSNEAYRKLSQTDSGDYYYYPRLLDIGGEKEITAVVSGFVMRADWLRELGLEAPETYDEWYRVLKAFQEQKGAAAPFSGRVAEIKKGFESGFGFLLSYYLDGDKVKYGYYTPQYQDYLRTMHKWYNEGLLDQNFANIDERMLTAKMLSNEVGATYAWIGSGMGVWLKAAQEENFDLVGVQFPVMEKGSPVEYGSRNLPVASLGSAISADSEKKELAAHFLNFGYTEKGHMLNNFGIEGQTYHMENDYPRYTELVTNNVEGLSMQQVLSSYAGLDYLNSYRQDYRYIQQYYNMPQQQAAQKIWMQTSTDHIMPTVSLTEAESSEYAQIMTEITTYQNEMYLKFIMGAEPISKFDDYMNALKEMGIERAIEIKQNAYDRFLNK